VNAREHHRIAGIEGATLTFENPLQLDILAEHGWSVQEYKPISEVGIEDLHFKGNWQEVFNHGKAVNYNRDDPELCGRLSGGWSAIDMNRVASSWIQRSRFENWNRTIRLLEYTAAVSIHEVTMEGNPGHFSIHSRGTGNFIGSSADTTGHWHGPSVGYGAAGTVFWRYEYPGSSSVDAHSSFPYATLLDRVDGGLFLDQSRAGGPTKKMPNHMRHYVLWNFRNVADGISEPFPFWDPVNSKAPQFLLPIVEGFHGNELEFVKEQLEFEESHGEPVSPVSLYEAQFEDRSGELPTRHSFSKPARYRTLVCGPSLPIAFCASRPCSPRTWWLKRGVHSEFALASHWISI